MSVSVNRLRPGVYISREDKSARAASGRAVYIIGTDALGTGEIFECCAGRTSPFAAGEGEGSLAALCSAALANGAAKCYAVNLASEDDLDDILDDVAGRSDVAVIMLAESLYADAVCGVCSAAGASGRELICVIAAPGTAQAVSVAASLNSERAVIVGQPATLGEVTSSAVTAAALAGAVSHACTRPDNVTGAILSDIVLPVSSYEDDVCTLISEGVTAVEDTPSGVQVVRAVTTRTMSDGIPDPSFRDLSVVMTADGVIRELRTLLSGMLSNARNEPRTRMAVSTQAVILLEKKLREGLIEDYEVPLVTADPDDPAVCVVPLSFRPACALCSIHISTTVRL